MSLKGGRVTKLRSIVLASVGAAAFFSAGAYGGYALASLRNTQWGWLCHTMATETYIDALRKLRHGELDSAKSTLEKRVDLHVFLMQDRSEIMTESTARSTRDALIKVKRYREEFPWAGGDPQTTAAVVKALSEIEAGK
jgi:hypothetical protein